MYTPLGLTSPRTTYTSGGMHIANIGFCIFLAKRSLLPEGNTIKHKHVLAR